MHPFARWLVGLGALAACLCVLLLATAGQLVETPLLRERTAAVVPMLAGHAPVDVLRTYGIAALAWSVLVMGAGGAARAAPLTLAVRVRIGMLLASLLALFLLAASIAGFEALYNDNRLVHALFVIPAVGGVTLLLLAVLPRTLQINLAVLLFLLAIVEGVFSILGPGAGPEIRWDVDVSDGGTVTTRTEGIGYVPRPEIEARVVKTIEGTEIYDVVYRFDDRGRRMVPTVGAGQDGFLLFFGGSRTFGEGVNDDQTIPYHVGRALPEYRPYSYSYSAWGPAQFLSILESRDLREEIRGRRGTVVYFMIDHHVNRTAGSYLCATRYWHGFTPCYRRGADGSIVRRGMFVNGRPIRQFFYFLLDGSPTFSYFVNELPLGAEADVLTVDVVREIQRRLSDLFAIDRFVVFYHPGHQGLERLSPLLEVRGLEHRSLVDLFAVDDPRYVFPRDTHLNPEGNRKVAEAMVAHLSRQATRRPVPRESAAVAPADGWSAGNPRARMGPS